MSRLRCAFPAASCALGFGRAPLCFQPLSRLCSSTGVSKHWLRVLADGQTPYNGFVSASLEAGAVVEVGGVRGLVTQQHLDVNGSELHVGDAVTVFAVQKSKDTGKVTFELLPRAARVQQLKSLQSDGMRPYSGVVTSMEAYGVFLDIGFERSAFLPFDKSSEASTGEKVALEQEARETGTRVRLVRDLSVGDNVVVYVIRCDWKSGRVEVSLQRRERPLLHFDQVAADGQTPYSSTVLDVRDEFALLDLGCESRGILWRQVRGRENQPPNVLEVGAEVTVYVTCKDRRTRRLSLSTRRGEEPRKRWDDLVADGQTPYMGSVHTCLPSGHYLMDIGAQIFAILPNMAHELTAGQEFTVYINEKKHSTGRVTVTSSRRETPRTSLAEVVVDAHSPYEGRVTNVTAHGAWVDIGSALSGLLPAGEETHPPAVPAISRAPPPSMEPGDTLTVYAWYRQWGKLRLGLWPRQGGPSCTLANLPVDGVTALEGTILMHRDLQTYVDICAEVIGVIRWDDLCSFAPGGVPALQALKPGAAVRVYARSRNEVTRKVRLALVPEARERRRLQEVLASKQRQLHDARVVAIERGIVFIDFHCDSTGIVEEATSEVARRLSVGNCVRVQPVAFDASGRCTVKVETPSWKGLLEALVPESSQEYVAEHSQGGWQAWVRVQPPLGDRSEFRGSPHTQREDAEHSAAARAVSYLSDRAEGEGVMPRQF